jgi:anti-anti-sigma factor
MPLSPQRLLEEETLGDAAFARLNIERLSESDIDKVRTELFGLATRRTGQHLQLDLARLGYLTSSGLGVLVALHNRVRAAGGRLSLHNVNEMVYELFAVTRLTTVLDVHPTPSDGDASIATPG